MNMIRHAISMVLMVLVAQILAERNVDLATPMTIVNIVVEGTLSSVDEMAM